MMADLFIIALIFILLFCVAANLAPLPTHGLPWYYDWRKRK